MMGPDRVAQICDIDNSAPFYRGTDAFLTDVVRIQREMVEDLIGARCDGLFEAVVRGRG